MSTVRLLIILFIIYFIIRYIRSIGNKSKSENNVQGTPPEQKTQTRTDEIIDANFKDLPKE